MVNLKKGSGVKFMILSFVMVSLFCLVLTGVSNAGEATQKTKLRFLVEAGVSKSCKELAERFEKENPNIAVEVIVAPWPDLHPKLALSFSQVIPYYDVIYSDWGWIAEFVDAGWIIPTEDLAPPGYKASKWLKEEWSYKGKQYYLAGDNNTYILLYNEEMLEKAGIKNPPKTWKELIQQSLKLKESGISEYPLSLGLKATEGLSQAMNIVLDTYVAETWTEKGYPAFNTERGREAVKLFYEMMNKYKIIDPGDIQIIDHDAWRDLASGRAAFGLNWMMYYPFVNDTEKSKVAGKVKLALIPGTEVKKTSAIASGMGWALSAKTPSMSAAKEFIRFLATKESSKTMLIGTGMLGAYSSLYDDPEVQAALPYWPILKEVDLFMKSLPKFAWYAEASDRWARACQEAIIGQKPIEQIFNKAEKDILKIIKTY